MAPETATTAPATVKAIREALARDVLSGALAAADAPARYTREVDAWLTALFEEATEHAPRGYALVAVGGHGRARLCPGSDLDLVLVHRRRRRYREVANHIWYAIWDTGLRLDHSVRTPSEVLQMARSDLRVILGWLDARLVVGDPALTTPLIERAHDIWSKEAAHFLPALEESVTERHRTFGELAFLLEPDLKQSAGGLRDIAALRAAASALPEVASLADSPVVARAELTISSARVVVQARTGSNSDRLALEEQDQVADILGYRDADALMADIAEAGRAVASRSTEAWRRVRAQFSGPENGHPSLELGNGVVLRSGEVGLDPEADVAGDASLVLRVAVAAAERQALIDQRALDRLESDAPAPKEPWNDELRQLFVRLLATGDALVPVVEALDQRHLFDRLVPEWRAVRNRPQRNAYHRYTVDRHLLEAVARAAEHLGEVARGDLLLLGALLHDIGKGHDGDHSEVGTVIAERILQRMGYGSADIETVVDLVAYHLVLPEFATRRDLEDPSTAAVVAKLVKDKERLGLLAALVESDGRATGTAAWGPWKAELVARLVDKVAAVLDGVPVPDPVAPSPSPEQLELLRAGVLAVHAVGRRVTVVAPDRPGLLAAVAGALALNGCNVRRATASSGGHAMAIEVFDVEPAFDRLPDWSKVERDIGSALDGTLALGQRLDDQDRVYARHRRVLAAHPGEANVTIDNETSSRATIIEVRTPDRIGILYRISAAVADSGLDVSAALVDTLGHEVIDTFYVCEPNDGKALDPARLSTIRATLEAVVARDR